MGPICNGVILSGGLNTRMGGQNKAFLKIGKRRFLDRIVDAVTPACGNISIVTREPELFRGEPLKVVEDILHVRSPLAGIHAGLVNMSGDYAFCTSCDAPFLTTRIVRIIVEEIECGYDVIVPASGGYYQPLCAVYSRRCLPLIEAQLGLFDRKVDHLFEKVRVKKISYEKFRREDPELNCFFNVNTPEDFEKAKRWIADYHPWGRSRPVRK